MSVTFAEIDARQAFDRLNGLQFAIAENADAVADRCTSFKTCDERNTV
ncbi:MAG: hypothetical protein IPK17_38225 [Chloroflexi bacterium]|nr:hypothetical protein [Chloroflexota bacterium]